MKAIPFLNRFLQPISYGEKTMTCRMKKYGEPGDILYVPVSPDIRPLMIQILEVRQVKLGEVAGLYYREEGCATTRDFMNVWNQIHPKRGFDSEQVVWLHIFKALK